MSDPLDSFLDRPIAFQRGYVTITGSITAALMLSQAYYWSGRTGDPDGWFYKTQEEWTKETGMTRLEQESARKILRELGLVEENYERLTHRMWYRLDKSKLRSLCLRMSETDIGECGKPAVGNAGNRHSCNSAETSTETTKGLLVLEKDSTKKPATILDHLTPQFDTPEFKEAWEGFEQHRKKVKAALTPRAIKLLANDLRQWGCQKSIASIDQTVKNGKWTGLFEPKDFVPPVNGNGARKPDPLWTEWLTTDSAQRYGGKFPTWESAEKDPALRDVVRGAFRRWKEAR
jgi:hypothetical protein